MIRTFPGVGDEAINSAFITEGLDAVSCLNPPPRVQISTVGMRTYCPVCKQEGYIAPHFRLVDQRTGTPLRNAPYRIVTDDDTEYEGRTDFQGHIQRVSNESAIGATLHVIANETPINPDWESLSVRRYV
jgi:hypothetical protein